MHPFYGLKLSVQQNLCEGYWLKYNASAKGGCYRNYHVFSCQLWCHDTLGSTPYKRIGYLWPNSHQMDAPHWEVYESFIGICVKHCEAKGKHGKWICYWRSFGLLHKIHSRKWNPWRGYGMMRSLPWMMKKRKWPPS